MASAMQSQQMHHQQQQQQHQHQQRHYHQRQENQGAQRQYEEKVKSIDFDAELDDSDTEAAVHHRRGLLAAYEDGRQRSRAMTRPVVTATAVSASVVSLHQAVRTRPVSGGGHRPSSVARVEPLPVPLTAPLTPSHWSTQSAVARKAAANQKRPLQQRHQQQEEVTGRPRSSSESSFGRIFFGWRRPTYQQPQQQQQLAATGITDNEFSMATAQQPAHYRGKNLHNFSYADAKIYSPNSSHQQQQPQPRQNKKQQQSANRQQAKIWWTMDTMNAVNSAHSNQMMLARGAPATASVGMQGDYC